MDWLRRLWTAIVNPTNRCPHCGRSMTLEQFRWHSNIGPRWRDLRG